jgi:two-component system, chemotaxis family, sensor kinase CheA
VTVSDNRLYELLAGEVERRLSLLGTESPATQDVRAALHSLKGSAGMAGFTDLALVIGQLSSRLRQGDPDALRLCSELLKEVLERLKAHKPPFSARWPEPPPGLVPSEVDPRFRSEYLAAMRERLAELDEALGGDEEPAAVLEQAYRGAHAMKGAAGAVGDDVTAWYCHGLEAWLKKPRDEEAAGDAVARLARHQAILAMLLDEPAHALDALRAVAAHKSAPRAGRLSTRPPPSQPAAGSSPFQSRPQQTEDEAQTEELLLRLPSGVVDRMLERLEGFDVVHDELTNVAEVARQVGGRLRDLRVSLHEALRLIGPARPWGAPAAALQRIEAAARTLGAAADHAERGSAACRRNAEVLRSRSGEMRAEVASLRRTSLSWLFARVAHAVERFAASEGRYIRVEITGAELLIDRRVAERLLETVIQLARNAVAHGIQRPEQRVAKGKPPVGTITLRAERLGDWLRIAVEDDGEGVDVERIRELAVQRGVVPADSAVSLHQDELLALLFLPGFTTQAGADLLAGRGVGLDLAQDVVRRLGGAIRLGSRRGSGLTATVDVPGERGLVDVLWLRAAGWEFALPVSFTGKVELMPMRMPVVPLTTCLGLSAAPSAKLGLELSMIGVQPIAIGIDDVGEFQEAAIRAVPALVAAAGPYTGAVLRGDGALRLVLDPALLAARAWAYAS